MATYDIIYAFLNSYIFLKYTKNNKAYGKLGISHSKYIHNFITRALAKNKIILEWNYLQSWKTSWVFQKVNVNWCRKNK